MFALANATTGRWYDIKMVHLKTMPHSFEHFSAVYCSYDHRIYIFGGEGRNLNDSYSYDCAVLSYDIDQDKWNDYKVPNLTDYSKEYSACSYKSIIYVFKSDHVAFLDVSKEQLQWL